MDGGIGSEMDLRSPKNANDDPTWCGCHHISNPEILQKLYEDFVISGAQMLSANTYSVLQYLLREKDTGIQASVTKAVGIVEQVRKLHPHIAIAGCLSAHGCHKYSDDEIRKSLILLASCLAKSSVDCILVEMVQNRHIGKIMVDAANTANLPLMIGFSIVRDGEFLKLKTKDVLFTPDVVRHILSDVRNVKCVGVMHSSVCVIHEALAVIERVWKGDTIAYPDCGTFNDNMWTTDASEQNIQEISEMLLDCKEKHPKLQVIGGCCGLGPSFIKKLKTIFEPYLNQSETVRLYTRNLVRGNIRH